MPLTAADRTELERLGPENVRPKLDRANHKSDSLVPGLGQGSGMRRGDVEAWLAEQSRSEAKQRSATLWAAIAGALIGLCSLAVAIYAAFK